MYGVYGIMGSNWSVAELGKMTEEEVAGALERAEAICRRARARLTRTRRQILEIVLRGAAPATASDILQQLRPVERSATPAAVYRSVEFLIQHGLVHRLDSAKAFIACAIPEHEHPSQVLICRRCGTVIETEDRHVASATHALSHKLGFALDRHVVELTGLCGPCRT